MKIKTIAAKGRFRLDPAQEIEKPGPAAPVRHAASALFPEPTKATLGKALHRAVVKAVVPGRAFQDDPTVARVSEVPKASAQEK